MRAAFISMICVLAASVALCVASMLLQFRLLDSMDESCGRAVACVLDEDISGAMEHVSVLKEKLESASVLVELVASHDQLHEALSSIVEAQVALECEDLDDAYQALARLQGTVDHLRQHERLSISNLC